jgi:hypothetical protein
MRALPLLLLLITFAAIVSASSLTSITSVYGQYGQPSGNIFPQYGPLYYNSSTPASITTTIPPTSEIADFIIYENGTGQATFEISSRILYFYHTITPSDGYIYRNGSTFFPNGTRIDINNFDFTQITPMANSTLTPTVQPPTTEPSVPQQQPLQQQQAPPTLPSTLFSGPTSDPDLLRFNEILAQCNAKIVEMNPLGEQGKFQQPGQSGLDDLKQCTTALKQAVTKYCEDFETYDAAKCSYINTPAIKQWLDAADRIVYFGTGLNILEPQ